MSHSDYSLAFYTGTGRLTDRVIRWVTRSRFSHVELVHHYGTSLCRSISSSARDGGVRIKEINFDTGHWKIVPLRGWAAPDAWARAACHLGARYDFTGILFSQILSLHRQDSARWFCSELCAEALGILEPQRLAPGDLYYLVLELNAAFVGGLQQAETR